MSRQARAPLPELEPGGALDDLGLHPLRSRLSLIDRSQTTQERLPMATTQPNQWPASQAVANRVRAGSSSASSAVAPADYRGLPCPGASVWREQGREAQRASPQASKRSGSRMSAFGPSTSYTSCRFREIIEQPLVLHVYIHPDDLVQS